jgi:hypothetical protein
MGRKETVPARQCTAEFGQEAGWSAGLRRSGSVAERLSGATVDGDEWVTQWKFDSRSAWMSYQAKG